MFTPLAETERPSNETGNMLAALVPHAFTAVTVMVPDVAPGKREIVFVDEAPVHPAGNVQL